MDEETFEVAPDDAPRAVARDAGSRSAREPITDHTGTPLRKGKVYKYSLGYMNDSTGYFVGEYAKWFRNYEYDWDYVIKGSGNGPYEYGLRFFNYDSQSDTSVIYEGDHLRLRCDMQYWRKVGDRVKRSGNWSDGHRMVLETGSSKWHGIHRLKDVSTGEYVEHHWKGACTYGHENKALFFFVEDKNAS
ncbi:MULTISPECIES: hypothetical protein [unclassified Streptomyces]|uniref:hypothetical protein n=1 Tax=unclassified Streptomyces TaxID=2593676 RepID=UPI003806B3DF